MFDTFLISFRLRIAYKVNSFLHGLKSLPIIRRLLPTTLYDHQGLKAAATIVALLKEFFGMFIGRILYFALMFLLPIAALESEDPTAGFLHLLVFLTLIGMLINNPLFEPTQDKYYAMFLLQMDARRYVVTDYGYYLLKLLVGFTISALLFGWLMMDLPAWLCLLIPLFVAAGKLTASGLTLLRWKRKGTLVSGKKIDGVKLAVLMALLAGAYVPLVLEWAIPLSVFCVLLTLFLVCGCVSAVYLVRFGGYRKAYKEQFAESAALLGQVSTASITQENYQNKLELHVDESHKTGCAYFHELFVRRHRKLLTQSAKRITAAAAVIVLALCGAVLFIPGLDDGIHAFLTDSLPTFLVVMYWINRGRGLTEALFFNCDHSMLTYRFFRQPKMLLELFTARLKTLIVINLMPAAVIAAGLPLLLLLSGGPTHPVHYLVLPLSILAMSVFFSVHTLVLYYLLQPYNVGLESRSHAYSIVNALTYAISYFFIQIELPAIAFGSCIIGFCVIYVLLALVLAYHLAPKTFKLRT